MTSRVLIPSAVRAIDLDAINRRFTDENLKRGPSNGSPQEPVTTVALQPGAA